MRESPDGYRSRRILIIERDPQCVQTLSWKLTHAGFSVLTVGSSEEARAAIDRLPPHLVLLDWELPQNTTHDLLRRIRKAGARAPRVIALSSFADEEHVVGGFGHGVDDYIVKPFSVPEVVARVRSVLRTMRVVDDDVDYLKLGAIRIDVNTSRQAGIGRMIVNGCAVPMRAVELRLLEFLMRHPERAFQRAALLGRVWGRTSRLEVRVVDLTIQRIRRALKPHGCDDYLQTVRGVGYRFSASSAAGRR